MYTLENTVVTEWFERDRANVRLDTMDDRLIINLWDEEVSQFVDDGFHNRHYSWHQSLVDYANEMKIKAGELQ